MRCAILWVVLAASTTALAEDAAQKESALKDVLSKACTGWEGFEAGSWRETVTRRSIDGHDSEEGERATLVAVRDEEFEIEIKTWGIATLPNGDKEPGATATRTEVVARKSRDEIRKVKWLKTEELSIGGETFECEVFDVVKATPPEPDAIGTQEQIHVSRVWRCARVAGGQGILKIEDRQEGPAPFSTDTDAHVTEVASKAVIGGKEVIGIKMTFGGQFCGEEVTDRGTTFRSLDVPGGIIAVEFAYQTCKPAPRVISRTNSRLVDFKAVRASTPR